LEDRVERGGEAGRGGYHLVARAQAALAQLGRGERREGEQVGRGSGVAEDRVPPAGEAREPALEPAGEAARGEPEVERGVHQRDELHVVEDAAGGRDRGRG